MEEQDENKKKKNKLTAKLFNYKKNLYKITKLQITK